MIITAHWSVTPNSRQRDYHIEFGTNSKIDAEFNASLGKIKDPREIDWSLLKSKFNIYKNNDLSDVTTYGTYRLNSDPRDGSANIEIAALTMSGAHVTTTGSWGSDPYSYAHAWMHAAIIARVCFIKNIDTNGSFSTAVEPSVLQNGPIYVVSTHGERALQTQDLGEDTVPIRGYGIFSGDSQCRWDIAALDESENDKLGSPDTAIQSVKDSAAWIREKAHLIKASGVRDLWNLDKAHT